MGSEGQEFLQDGSAGRARSVQLRTGTRDRRGWRKRGRYRVSQWDGTAGRINADFTLYPSTGHRKKKNAPAWEINFGVAAPTAATTTVRVNTVRVNWTATRVTWTIMAGTVPIHRTANVLKADTYSEKTTDIPQVPLPIAMNLWAFKTLPTHPWDIVIADFQFIPQIGAQQFTSCSTITNQVTELI